VCDLAYVVQVEQIERRALAEMQLAPHVEDSSKIATPEVAVAEFDAWLMAPPNHLSRPTAESEIMDLFQGVR
jgi:hypothetical protein